MSNEIINVTDASFQKDVLESDLPVILDFWAPWCGPCKAISPMLERSAKEYSGVLRFAKYDVDQSEQSRERYGVRGVPTLVAYRHGKEILRTTGVSASSMQAILNAALHESQKSETAVPSFKGDTALKQTAIQILQETQLEVAGENGETSFQLPTAVLTERLKGDYADSLGLPGFVGILHDGLFELCVSNIDAHDIAVRWLDAIPVGKQIDALLPALARAVLHDADLGFLPGLAKQIASPLLKSFLTDLLALQAHGGDELQWSELLKRLEALNTELAKTPDEHLVSLMRDFSKPLDRYAALDLMTVLPMTVSFGIQSAQSPLSPEEEKTMNILQERIQAIYNESVPEGLDDTAAKEWDEQKQKRCEDIVQAFWKEYPLIEQRIKERDELMRITYNKRLLASLEMLFSVIKSTY